MSGAYWDVLRPHLERPSLAPDLPGRRDKPADPMTLTVDECVRSFADDVRAADPGDVVLVAHSSGGLFAPGIAAELADRVRHVVLDVAQVPPDGGTGLDAMKESHRARIIEGMDWAREQREGAHDARARGPRQGAWRLRRRAADRRADRVHDRSGALRRGLDELLLPAGVLERGARRAGHLRQAHAGPADAARPAGRQHRQTGGVGPGARRRGAGLWAHPRGHEPRGARGDPQPRREGIARQRHEPGRGRAVLGPVRRGDRLEPVRRLAADARRGTAVPQRRARLLRARPGSPTSSARTRTR